MNEPRLNRTFFLLYRFVLGPLAVVLILGAGISNALRAGAISNEFACVHIFLAAIWYAFIGGGADGFRRNYWRDTFPGWPITPLPLSICKLMAVGGVLFSVIGSGFLA